MNGMIEPCKVRNSGRWATKACMVSHAWSDKLVGIVPTTIFVANASISNVDNQPDRIISLRVAKSLHNFCVFRAFGTFGKRRVRSILLNKVYFSGPVRSLHFNELVSLQHKSENFARAHKKWFLLLEILSST